MTKELFQAEYSVDDGYVGKSRPHYFEIDGRDIEDDFTESDIEDLFNELMQRSFEDSIFPSGDPTTFIEWGKAVLDERRKQ